MRLTRDACESEARSRLTKFFYRPYGVWECDNNNCDATVYLSLLKSEADDYVYFDIVIS